MALKLRSMMKKHKWLRIIFWLVVVVLLFRLGYLAYQKYQDYSPIEKSKPQYYMIISGHVDPKIYAHYNIELSGFYYSANSDCDYFESILDIPEGVASQRTKYFTFDNVQSQSGDFFVKIPLDRYKSRHCQWKIGEVDYAIQGNNGLIYLNQIIANFSSPDTATTRYIGGGLKKYYEAMRFYKSSNHKLSYFNSVLCGKSGCTLESNDLPEFSMQPNNTIKFKLEVKQKGG